MDFMCSVSPSWNPSRFPGGNRTFFKANFAFSRQILEAILATKYSEIRNLCARLCPWEPAGPLTPASPALTPDQRGQPQEPRGPLIKSVGAGPSHRLLEATVEKLTPPFELGFPTESVATWLSAAPPPKYLQISPSVGEMLICRRRCVVGSLITGVSAVSGEPACLVNKHRAGFVVLSSRWSSSSDEADEDCCWQVTAAMLLQKCLCPQLLPTRSDASRNLEAEIWDYSRRRDRF